MAELSLNSLKAQIDTKQNNLGFTPENVSNKGMANGYASLDGSGLVPVAQLPKRTFSCVLNLTNPPPDQETGRLSIDVPCKLTQVRVMCNTTPSASTVINVYKNDTATLLAGIACSAANTIYDVSPDYNLSLNDVAFAKLSGNNNNVLIFSIQLTFQEL